MREPQSSRLIRHSTPLHRRIPVLGLLAIGMLVSSCDGPPPTLVEIPGEPSFKSDAGRGQGQFATVMTRNLYVGMNFTEVLSAAPPNGTLLDLASAVHRAHMNLIESLPAERMARIAEEIAVQRPDLVGLQEVFQVFVDGSLQYDFLELLLDALRTRGARYEVAVVHTALEISAPALAPTGAIYFAGVVDRQAILVRRGVQFWNPDSGAFDHRIVIDLGVPGVDPVPWNRGWTALDARVHGRTLRFFNTHLETQLAAPINVLQGNQLIEIAKLSTHPVVLVGDFNSAANPSAPAGSRTATYGKILEAGLMDAWLAAGGDRDAGLTCCHDPDLRNPPSAFDQRIDFVFFDGFRGAESLDVIGDEVGDRTPSGLWPSDHAGLSARIRLP
jgi:endonuclease/exonuclease/phosphatase family metal-dependent hydrolase